MHKNYSLLLNYCSFALILLVWNEINVIAKDILLSVKSKPQIKDVEEEGNRNWRTDKKRRMLNWRRFRSHARLHRNYGITL